MYPWYHVRDTQHACSMLRENKDLMTNQDLRDLVAAVSVKQAEMVDLLRESKRETDQQIQESARRFDEQVQASARRFDEQLQASARRFDEQNLATEELIQETDRQLQALARKCRETEEQVQETGRQLREVGRQLGRLGDKFGSFTEGMALSSMTKILIQRFGMQRGGNYHLLLHHTAETIARQAGHDQRLGKVAAITIATQPISSRIGVRGLAHKMQQAIGCTDGDCGGIGRHEHVGQGCKISDASPDR